MRYFKQRRGTGRAIHDAALRDENPMSGVANLFDCSVVFIVALIMSLFGAFHLQELFDRTSEMTLLKQKPSGELEIITKKGTQVNAMKISKAEAAGRGQRLGIAYRLEDGSTIYVPEER